MNRLDIVGLGAWSPTFVSWQAFCTGLQTGTWSTDAVLQPDLIPPRERRRAPQLVKMAIEVMNQACTMANIRPDDVAVIFSSAMGDMQITDYMCRALAETPKLISPTRFHNSVHNAAPGYWSITTGTFTPASAVSAYEYTPSMAFLEAAIQVVEENTPVVLVTQEIAAPLPLLDTCPSEHPFSAAFLMTPPGFSESATCSLEFSVLQEAADWPALAPMFDDDFRSNFGARLLPLLTAIASDQSAVDLRFPISDRSCLAISRLPQRGNSD